MRPIICADYVSSGSEESYKDCVIWGEISKSVMSCKVRLHLYSYSSQKILQHIYNSNAIVQCIQIEKQSMHTGCEYLN